ncbi:MAG: hypothetical protein M1375_00730 [Candidatus Thermoplasmatota archaeon]|jgi:hypothetical protein|nr:hypothetical protein [Candidatus Thermoplasmatota archaeon]MCL5790483.1 hypothetical protein [Candidatus Thermoplasmatota archaeon]
MSDKPNIREDKLKEYLIQNRSYSLYENDDRSIELHFSPEMPEAIAHFPNGEPVEHIMYGFIDNGTIYFTKFKTVSSLGETETELEGEDDPVMLWLQFI